MTEQSNYPDTPEERYENDTKNSEQLGSAYIPFRDINTFIEDAELLSKHDVQIVSICWEGIGRSHQLSQMLKQRYPKLKILRLSQGFKDIAQLDEEHKKKLYTALSKFKLVISWMSPGELLQWDEMLSLHQTMSQELKTTFLTPPLNKDDLQLKKNLPFSSIYSVLDEINENKQI